MNVRKGREPEKGFVDAAREIVANYHRKHFIGPYGMDALPGDIRVVWFSETLQNWKCVMDTAFEPGLLYEVSHDGEMRRTYIDVYKRTDSVAMEDE